MQTLTEEEAEIGETSQYPYSVKITQTAYGARISVHAYAYIPEEAMAHAMAMYESTRKGLLDNGFKVAPEEPVSKKENNKEK